MFPDGHVRLKEKTSRKNVTKKRIKEAVEDFYIGKLSEADVQTKLNGFNAYLKNGDTKAFRRYLKHRYVFTHDKDLFYKDRSHEYKKKGN